MMMNHTRASVQERAGFGDGGDGRISDTQLCTDPRNALAGRIATTQPITLPNFAETAGKPL
jgi:hypothetical protein